MPEAPIRVAITSTFEEAAALAALVGRIWMNLPGSDPDAIDALRLGLAEALNNIVAHAYGGLPGRPIRAELRATPDGCEVLLSDEGAPMPDGYAPEKGAEFNAGDLATLPEGGFGWPLIRAQVDAVEYRRQDGCNLLRLAKRLEPAG